MATEKELRNTVATWGNQYLGIPEGGSAHKALIDMFNNSGLCTRYKMTVNDAWCALFVSDAFIANGLTGIFPCVECSCDSMISLAKSAGIWVEDDSYTPSIADVVLYDWDDSGSGDCTGSADHVGIVQSVNGSTFTVIEGNKSDTVGIRTMSINGRYIRGFITPNFASAASSGSSGSTGSTDGKVTSVDIDYADYFDASLAGDYTVTASSLNLRSGANTNKTILAEIPNGGKVHCYGYYSRTSGENWLLVEYVSGDTTYTGFVCATYLNGGTTTSGGTSQVAPLYYVQVTVSYLNIRSGAGTNYGVVGQTGIGVFGITEEKSGQVDSGTGTWGKLLSGAGWIWLGAEHVKKI